MTSTLYRQLSSLSRQKHIVPPIISGRISSILWKTTCLTSKQYHTTTRTTSTTTTTTTTTTTNQSNGSMLLKQFQLYNWKPYLHLSDDYNYMDLVLLITRNSLLKQGSMGCIIVKPDDNTDTDNNNNYDDDDDDNNMYNNNSNKEEQLRNKLFQRLSKSIIAASTNEALYNHNDSDIHAEIVALGQCNQSENVSSTKHCTAYITMSPCKRCFSALVKAGITKIVTRVPFPNIIINVANREGIELVNLSCDDEMFRMNQNGRIQELVHNYNNKNKLT